MVKVGSAEVLGIALVVAAAIAWSTAPLLVRLIPFDSWTILFWRGIFGGGLIVVFLVATQGRAGLRELLAINRGGVLVAVLSTLGMVAYIPALQVTSVANVAIIIATTPFVAGAMAWAWFGEIPRTRTMFASMVAVAGVAITVGGAAVASDLSGILLAAFMTVAIAGMIVAVRRYRETSMVAAGALSNFLGSAVSIPFALGISSVSANDILVLAGLGGFQIALGVTLFVLGSRLLPSAQASLISTLETPLMPLWIWLAFKDVPTGNQLIGGAIVLAAVVADAVGELRSRESDRLRS